MLQMSTEQSTTHEEGRRTTFFENTKRSIERNQYQCYWTITKIEWKECNSGYYGLIYKNNSTQGNND